MKLKKYATKALAAAVFAGLAITSAATHAATINSLFVSGENTIQDTDAERILDSTGTVKTTGGYAEGDTIESILRFDTANAGAISDSLPSPYQLTAYSQLGIAAIIDGNGGTLDLNDPVRLIFGATGNLGTNVLVDLFERTSSLQPGFSVSALPATGIANVLGQTLISQLGFGELDDFWYADTINNIGLLGTHGSGQAAAGVFGISLLSNAGGLPIITNGIQSPIDLNMHDVVGDASVYARDTGVNPGWLLSSNLNASFNVPEPATLALLGAGLMGIGASARRRKANG